MADTIEVVERGARISFSFADVLKYHGPGSPGGAAHAFKVLARALPLLDPDGPCERREIVIETAFGGPGARDAFEMVTRAVTGDRFRVDRALARPERGRALEAFVFRLGYRGRTLRVEVTDHLATYELLDGEALEIIHDTDRVTGEQLAQDEVLLRTGDQPGRRAAPPGRDAAQHAEGQ